ncbi:MAG: translesion error-prone DNA polymerase V autoproteolytic subunit [Alphaproteobacteria bacterium]|nr:translesion error-prone DNA polymerase V autoproteolytic subunit [Alphaproteobacteria bacterium]
MANNKNTNKKPSAGGKREGSGRKPNSGKFKEPTKAIRVPESYVEDLTTWLNEIANNPESSQPDFPFPTHNFKTATLKPEAFANILVPEVSPALLAMPFYDCSVSAGFPSPADDSFGLTMDLNKHLVQNAPATFFVRTSGESMLNAGINDGDLLVVDRSLIAKNNDIVIAAVDGDLTVKRLVHNNGKTILQAENPAFSNIELSGDMAVSLWGVVTNVIHSLRN